MGQDGSKVNIMSRVLIEVKLKLVVMSKKKGVSQPKMWLMGQTRLDSAGT